MKNINWKAYLTGLLSAFTLAFVGGVFDFQNIKAAVRSVKNDVKALKTHDKKVDATVRAIGIIVCKYAIKDEMKDASEICKDVLE